MLCAGDSDCQKLAYHCRCVRRCQFQLTQSTVQNNFPHRHNIHHTPRPLIHSHYFLRLGCHSNWSFVSAIQPVRDANYYPHPLETFCHYLHRHVIVPERPIRRKRQRRICFPCSWPFFELAWYCRKINCEVSQSVIPPRCSKARIETSKRTLLK